MSRMPWVLALGLLLVLLPISGEAQRLLTLDSCRAMALRNNKQMSVAITQQEVAANKRKSARTQYLPHVSALGTYQYTSKPISLLSDEQKASLPQTGTALGSSLQQNLAGTLSQLPPQTKGLFQQMGLSNEAISQLAAQGINGLAAALNGVGQGLVDALDTDTRNLFAGAIIVNQPLYMGGAIKAANKIADISEEMAANSLESKRQSILYNVDKAYWQVVSLNHKQKLAESFLELVKKLNGDMQKMISQGVATKGDGLSVAVRVNEAEMALTQVKDGLVLSKMLLCQLCGLPIDEQVTLADEETENVVAAEVSAQPDMALAAQNRPELKLLQNTVDLSKQTTNLLKAGNLPQVLLSGGYAVMNPNTFNGFERKFSGVWNVGVVMRIPIWNWGDVKYKVRASKGATTIANMELADAREMIELQVNQSSFRVTEANKKLAMANANIANANENLRMANLGFKEGTVSYTTVMEAQTAWQQAQSQKIDAEIGVRLSQIELQKALGTLR
ncbi:MAG: TolC family protein [Prevotella sp.]|nr:TolC family protein [Prevotella sp.]